MPFPLIPLLIGAGIGAATSDDPLKGALIGGATGAASATLPGLLGPSGATAPSAGLLAPAEAISGSGLSELVATEAAKTASTTPTASFFDKSVQGIASGLDGSAIEPVLTQQPAFGDLLVNKGLLDANAASVIAEGSDELVAAAQVPDKPGFASKLGAGLLQNADKLAPKKQQAQYIPSGSLPRGQFQPPGNLFLQFSRRRRQ